MDDVAAAKLVRDEAFKIGYGSIKHLLTEGSHREIRAVIQMAILKVANSPST